MILISGIGETPPIRRSGIDNRGMVLAACRDAIHDAGLEPGEIDAIVTDCAIMPVSVPQDFVAAQLGAGTAFSGGMSMGGAGIVGAPILARALIDSGQARRVLCYFGVDWGTSPGGPYAFHDMYPAKTAFEKPCGFTAQPSYFAMLARRYAHEYGAPADFLAPIAISSRANALRRGEGQAMRPLDIEAYRASRMISDPLRAADCCLISDGAGAYVMVGEAEAKRSRGGAVEILGAGFGSEPVSAEAVFTQGDLLRTPGAGSAAGWALRQAGIAIGDVDFAEIYDCFTISCLLQLEDVGFCAKGEGHAFVRDGRIGIGGPLPVNTHGGLLAYSYRLGIEHVTEAVRQLRGACGASQVEGARIGLVGGYSPPDYSVMILGR